MRWCRYFLPFVKLTLTLAIVEAIEKRFTKEDSCSETNRTLVEVNTCPENEKTFNESSKAKTCETYRKCQGETLFYHCVRINEQTLVEVCAPKHTVIGNHCPLFEKKLGRVIEDYNSNCSECPEGYDSHRFPIYLECVKTRKLPTYLTFTSHNVEEVDISGSSTPIVDTNVRTQTDENLNGFEYKSMNGTQQTKKEESEHTAIIIGTISAICFIGIILIFAYQKCKRANSSISTDSTKHSELQILNESNKSSA